MTTPEPRPLPEVLERLGLTGPAARWLMQRQQALVPVEKRSRTPGQAPALRPMRALMLWLFSLPLLLSAVSSLAAGRFDGFVGDAAAWSLIALSAVLTRRSSRTADAMPARRFRRYGRRWRFPLRNLAAALLGVGTGVAAVFGVGHMLAVGLGFGAVAVLGYHFAYGLEPMLVTDTPVPADKESRAVLDALAEAEDRLISIEAAASSIANHELSERLGRIAELGRGILVQIAERPSDLRRARRFLTVFLEGAEQVSNGYARSHQHADSAELEQNFRAVLVTIEDQFSRQRERLREADVLDLDVQIEVLKKQLEQEGVR